MVTMQDGDTDLQRYKTSTQAFLQDVAVLSFKAMGACLST